MQSDIKSLKKFLIKANKVGYGNPQVKMEETADDSCLINYEHGFYRFRDHFYGGHPYAGQEVIYEMDRAVWAMQYRGWLHDSESTSEKEVYTFLRKALLRAPQQHPYRGPKEYREGDLAYLNNWQGDMANFNGQETITKNDQPIYAGLYFGGMVDQ